MGLPAPPSRTPLFAFPNTAEIKKIQKRDFSETGKRGGGGGVGGGEQETHLEMIGIFGPSSLAPQPATLILSAKIPSPEEKSHRAQGEKRPHSKVAIGWGRAGEGQSEERKGALRG